jgi:hypothetical protein
MKGIEPHHAAVNAAGPNRFLERRGQAEVLARAEHRGRTVENHDLSEGEGLRRDTLLRRCTTRADDRQSGHGPKNKFHQLLHLRASRPASADVPRTD